MTHQLTSVQRPLRGRPPYGYRVAVQPGTGTVTFEPDPGSAPVVTRIFTDYLEGQGLRAIAEALTAAAVPSPSAYDPNRNPQHAGRAWSKGSVRAILVNRRYAVGPSTAVCGDAPAYPAIVAPEIYERVRLAFSADSRAGTTQPRPGARQRTYLFRGVLRCALCRRLMQGTWNNGEAYYRCRFPVEYATANRIAHPRNVYLRESRVVVPLDSWLDRALVETGHERPRLPVPRGDRVPAAGMYGAPDRLRDLGPVERTRLYASLRLNLTYAPEPTAEIRAAVVTGGHGRTVRGRVSL